MSSTKLRFRRCGASRWVQRESDAMTRVLSDIKRVLSQPFSAASLKEIDLRQGALLAYIAQLMIQTTKISDPHLQLPKTQ
jgi:hypothetical protein